MPLIKTPIEQFISDLTSKNIKVTFCEGIKPLEQVGQVCKLVAIQLVQEYLFKQGFHTEPPLPVRKDHNPLLQFSLRKRAKLEVDSKVGEIYGPGQIKKVSEYNGFTTQSYQMHNEEDYINFLIHSLERKHPVITYFDVTMGFESGAGEPVNRQGSFEHAAVIAGFYYEQEQLQLIALQWGHFYTFSAKNLYASTEQLSALKNPEHFQKYYFFPTKFPKHSWLETNQFSQALDRYCTQSVSRGFFSALNTVWPKSKARISTPPTDASGSLANIVTVIQGTRTELNLEGFQNFSLDKTNPDTQVNFSM
ncbi:MAG TPA: hypothetical protein PK657_14335 [Legionella sp.]|nr:hypothetical protein [Legionella sp.]